MSAAPAWALFDLLDRLAEAVDRREIGAPADRSCRQ